MAPAIEKGDHLLFYGNFPGLSFLLSCIKVGCMVDVEFHGASVEK